MKVKMEIGEIRIELEGTPEEIQKGMLSFTAQMEKFQKIQPSIKPNTPKSKSFAGSQIERIESLINDGFLDQPKRLSEIKHKLEELGYHYRVTSISPILLFLLRQRKIRRVGIKRKYQYVKP